MDGAEAVHQAYQAFYRSLVSQLYGVTGDLHEAQDVVQEAYARALARPAPFLEVREPEAWLRTVALNVARSRFRRRWVFDQLVGAGRIDHGAGTVPELSPDRVALIAALRRLRRPTREAIVLHHLADLPVEEVAATLGVPVGTVKARLSRGRATLARHLGDGPIAERPELGAERPDPAAERPSPPVTGPDTVPGRKEQLRHA